MGKRRGKHGHEPFRLSIIPFRQSWYNTNRVTEDKIWILQQNTLSLLDSNSFSFVNMTVIFYAYSRLFVVLLTLKVITVIIYIINNGLMYRSVQKGIVWELLPGKMRTRLHFQYSKYHLSSRHRSKRQKEVERISSLKQGNISQYCKIPSETVCGTQNLSIQLIRTIKQSVCEFNISTT